MIKYPNKKKLSTTTLIKQSASRRGMSLENDLNSTNQYYLDHEIAVIHKKPTPLTIVDVAYPSRNKAKIVEAYFKTPSTTDYNGVYNGLSIDFEAKEISSKTSFPFSFLHDHQIKHLRMVHKQKACAFLIIRFTYYDETFLIPCSKLFDFMDNNERKSLPYTWVKEEGYLIKQGIYPPLDYLKIIDII